MKLIFLLFATHLLPLSILAQQIPPTDPDVTRHSEQAESHEDDPFGSDNYDGSSISRPEKWRKDATVITTQIRTEWYEVDSLAVIQLLDDWKPVSKADELRKKIITLKKTQLTDTMLFRVDVGEKVSLETVQEMIYPTEYIPNGLVDPPKELKAPGKEAELREYLKKFITDSGLAPTAFETRNLGVTIEAALEPVKGQASAFDLSIAPEKVKQYGVIDCGSKGIVANMPIFGTIRANSTTRVHDGQWHLISIQPALDSKTGKSSSSRSLALLIRLDILK